MATVKGRVTATPDVLNASLRCRKHTPSAGEMEQASRMDTRADVVFYFEPDEDVQRDDRLVDGATTYLVTARLPPSVAHHLKCFAKDMQRGATA